MEKLILRGVYKGLSKKKIGEIIEEEVSNEPHVRISNRERPRVVFMTGEKDKVRELIRKRFVGKRWDRWKVEEKVDPIECYKCIKYGHKANYCKNEKVEERCHNCDSKFYQCGQKRHRAGIMNCPKYRNAVVEIKKEKRTEYNTEHNSGETAGRGKEDEEQERDEDNNLGTCQ
ncbi:hypothetical protein HHI36_018280 [Cryptolaemus montrouzieri]|uniref:CCHC-type domain-containing protein n=1 Tax=Cryptolaemus montrouzieri TaxID=559131 RepID=A0ABD2P0E9_9CUCU